MDNRISRVTLRVRGYHLDGYGHVNNARYLEFLEEGRWGYFDDRPELARYFASGNPALVAVNLNINYRQAAVGGDDLEVLTRVAELGHRSARIHQEIRRIGDGQPIADADLTFVLFDVRNQQSMPIEGEIRQALEPLVLPKEA
ncbi:acyl-CoA thioesterase [Halomonas sp. MCCC 1A17488]|uniref:acyl-CoA thioesterase n=1 Tax=unclassified Halomonas TaxID=2609666 RepID=UPI0018D24495|nr:MULTISPECIES: thioesterase family protein [unclassified Halomonas]MCE8014931.1 acyl-CoA thioesterase [Halomonas sp. MCCC 1A17488]MCG3238264.1 acyl-CoA thioesterase [Halomonas sp. MCCC 1A17488]QPP47975.1 acyl-CoA thioesterase [Halomonas sp. SS10-MC5]